MAAKKIEDGNTEIDLKVYTHDSIGDLTKAFLSLADNTNDLAEVAKKIGQGNYDVPVKIRGPHDVLGKSIVNMQESLKTATKELNDLVEELKLSNKYKSEFDKFNDAFRNFELVSGNDIHHWYQYDNYVDGGGTLNNSCMAEVGEEYLYIFYQYRVYLVLKVQHMEMRQYDYVLVL